MVNLILVRMFRSILPIAGGVIRARDDEAPRHVRASSKASPLRLYSGRGGRLNLALLATEQGRSSSSAVGRQLSRAKRRKRIGMCLKSCCTIKTGAAPPRKPSTPALPPEYGQPRGARVSPGTIFCRKAGAYSSHALDHHHPSICCNGAPVYACGRAISK